MDTTLDDKFTFKIVKTKEEREEIAHVTSYAFLPAPADLERHKKGLEVIKDSYILGVYEKNNPKPIATATCAPMTQNIRGKVVKMGGVEAVATSPEYRRSGIVKRLMEDILLHSYESGEVISTLYPFKEAFYAKYGYVSLPQAIMATTTFRSLANVKELDLNGSVKHFYLKDVFEEYYNFLVEMQSIIHGMSLKPKKVTEFYNNSSPYYVAFSYENGKITGTFLYTTQGHSSNMNIRYFLYKNSHAKYLLIEFLARHIDQFIEFTMPVLPFDHFELWFTGIRPEITTKPSSALAMGRILNLEALEGMNVGKGSLTINVIDDECPWNTGIFEFNSENKLLKIKKSDNGVNIDCTLTITGLSALIYGCYDLNDFPFRKWILDYNSEVLERLQELFPRILPYMHEDF